MSKINKLPGISFLFQLLTEVLFFMTSFQLFSPKNFQAPMETRQLFFMFNDFHTAV